VLLYDSSSKINFNNHASFLFEMCAHLYYDFNLKEVEFAYIDVNNGTLAPELTREEPIYPHVQIMPAEGKDKTPYPHTHITDIESLYNFIRNNINPHSRKLLDEYRNSIEKVESEDAGNENYKMKEDL
jgi:hypothetical protein